MLSSQLKYSHCKPDIVKGVIVKNVVKILLKILLLEKNYNVML